MKLVGILHGRLRLVGNYNREKIRKSLNDICRMLSTSDVLSRLYQNKVISQSDKEEINATEQSKGRSATALDLIFVLANKSTKWFSIFMTILVECGQKELAKLIDNKFTTGKVFYRTIGKSINMYLLLI